MGDFEREREEYFKEVRKNPEIISKLVSDNESTEKGQETLKLLLIPSNERELTVAKALFSMSSDVIKLIDDIEDDEVKDIPKEENKGFNYVIETINAIKSGKEVKPIFESDIEYAAKVMYEFFVGTIDCTEDAFEYIASKTGFNLDDELESMQFSLYIDKAKSIMQNLNGQKGNLSDCSDDEIKSSLEFAKAFHKCCEEGKKAKVLKPTNRFSFRNRPNSNNE